MRRAACALALIAALAVAGMAPATAAVAARHRHHRAHHHGGGTPSGVRGVVTAGPVCPVERIPPDPNCADRPIEARVLVTHGGGGVVASGSSGSDGSFEIRVAPGHYEVTATTKFAMRCDSVAVDVAAGAFTDVTVPCDTGIR